MSFPILEKALEQAESQYAGTLSEVQSEGRPEATRALLIAQAINLASLRIQFAIQSSKQS
jgi:hypothetical protein